jgi:hypothetical protein
LSGDINNEIEEFRIPLPHTERAIIAGRRGLPKNPRRSATSDLSAQWNPEDFGGAILRGDGDSGYIRVDWFTPYALPTRGERIISGLLRLRIDERINRC